MRNFFLYGLAGVGKDTVASILESVGYHTLALADGVRDEYTRWLHAADYRANRAKLIEIGEAYKTIYGQDVWCDRTLDRLREIHDIRGMAKSGHIETIGSPDFQAQTFRAVAAAGFVIRDGRYNHEFDYWVQQDFVPVLIQTTDAVRMDRMRRRDNVEPDADMMAFERAHFIDQTPAYVLTNDGSPGDLSQQIAQMLYTFSLPTSSNQEVDE